MTAYPMTPERLTRASDLDAALERAERAEAEVNTRNIEAVRIAQEVDRHALALLNIFPMTKERAERLIAWIQERVKNS